MAVYRFAYLQAAAPARVLDALGDLATDQARSANLLSLVDRIAISVGVLREKHLAWPKLIDLGNIGAGVAQHFLSDSRAPSGAAFGSLARLVLPMPRFPSGDWYVHQPPAPGRRIDAGRKDFVYLPRRFGGHSPSWRPGKRCRRRALRYHPKRWDLWERRLHGDPAARRQTAWTETDIYVFGAPNGITGPSYSGLTLDSSGSLYGVTFRGGAGQRSGVAFRLSPPPAGQTTWTATTLKSRKRSIRPRPLLTP